MNGAAKREFMVRFRPKLIGLLAANAVIWLATMTFYKMSWTFGLMFSAFTLPFLVFFFFSDSGVAVGETAGATLGKVFLYYGAVSGGVLILSLSFVMMKIGFPKMFIVTIVAFAVLCLLLFIFLEFKPPMREPKGIGAASNLLILYMGASGLYLLTSFILPQYDPVNEINKLRQTGLSLAGADKETVIKAGMQVFKDFECFNCHNAAPGGEPKRGPNLAEIDMGGRDKITESVTNPYKEILKPYADNPKVARSMPDYYAKQMSKDELEAIVTYMENIKAAGASAVSQEKMPKGWWSDPKVVEEGQKIYEGLVNEDVACHVCHGKDGKPLFEGAPDFTKNPDMENMTEARWFQIIQRGFKKDSPMTGWGALLNDEQMWKVIAYEWTFYAKSKLGKTGLVERKEPEGPNAIPVVREKYWD